LKQIIEMAVFGSIKERPKVTFCIIIIYVNRKPISMQARKFPKRAPECKFQRCVVFFVEVGAISDTNTVLSSDQFHIGIKRYSREKRPAGPQENFVVRMNGIEFDWIVADKSPYRGQSHEIECSRHEGVCKVPTPIIRSITRKRSLQLRSTKLACLRRKDQIVKSDAFLASANAKAVSVLDGEYCEIEVNPTTTSRDISAINVKIATSDK